MLSEFLQQRIDAGDFPSAVYLIAEKGDIVLHEALGNAVVEPERIKVRVDTIYDLASLTNVLVTGLLAAKLVEKGDIRLDDRVSIYLSEFDVDDKREITIRNLLAHDSGMKGWLPLYILTSDPAAITQVIADQPLDNKSGEKVIYSDPNFLVLTAVLEKIVGKRIDDLFANDVVDALS